LEGLAAQIIADIQQLYTDDRNFEGSTKTVAESFGGPGFSLKLHHVTLRQGASYLCDMHLFLELTNPEAFALGQPRRKDPLGKLLTRSVAYYTPPPDLDL